jgi:hypothetical protein
MTWREYVDSLAVGLDLSSPADLSSHRGRSYKCANTLLKVLTDKYGEPFEHSNVSTTMIDRFCTSRMDLFREPSVDTTTHYTEAESFINAYDPDAAESSSARQLDPIAIPDQSAFSPSSSSSSSSSSSKAAASAPVVTEPAAAMEVAPEIPRTDLDVSDDQSHTIFGTPHRITRQYAVGVDDDVPPPPPDSLPLRRSDSQSDVIGDNTVTRLDFGGPPEEPDTHQGGKRRRKSRKIHRKKRSTIRRRR